MDSTQTKLITILVVAVVASGGAMAALVLLQPPPNSSSDYSVELVGSDGVSQNVTLTEIQSMETITGNSSYQNTYGNVRGLGIYTGIRVSDLIDLVGGIGEDYILRVVAEDGYSQTFDRSKVYPNSTMLAIQGEMILAYEFEGQIVPDYTDGFRIAFIPEDGYYSNADANESTNPNPTAAGPQWVSNVARMEVLRDLYNSTLDVNESFLRTLPSVSGYGGYVKKSGEIIGPFNFTGVPFSILMLQFSSLPDDYFVTSLSGDGFTNEYSKSIVEGIVNGYTPTGDPIDEINSTMILAYEEDGTAIIDGGPLKIVFINEDGNLTDGFRWAKNVVSISILEVVTVHPMLSLKDTTSVEVLVVPTKHHL